MFSLSIIDFAALIAYLFHPLLASGIKKLPLIQLKIYPDFEFEMTPEVSVFFDFVKTYSNHP